MILFIIFILLLVFTGFLIFLTIKRERYNYATDYDDEKRPCQRLVAGTVWTSDSANNENSGLGWVL